MIYYSFTYQEMILLSVRWFKVMKINLLPYTIFIILKLMSKAIMEQSYMTPIQINFIFPI